MKPELKELATIRVPMELVGDQAAVAAYALQKLVEESNNCGLRGYKVVDQIVIETPLDTTVTGNAKSCYAFVIRGYKVGE